ncbi:hypothetical protein ACH41E_18795 [Streptomyces sp. NPDC020412]|uniref:hypothetical protein n=1 Tax=Streptomyces sp. NPDC020412 TaxID=3365073 RepID=UPI0037900BBD
MRAGSALRLVHTAVLTAVCAVVSGFGHDLASGDSPPGFAYGLALPPLAALAWRLTRKERSVGAVVGASAAAQVALHLLFAAVGHGGAPAAGTGAPHHPGPHLGMRSAPVAALDRVLDPGLLGSGMTFAHLLAGAICGWWLWRGEQALVQLARLGRAAPLPQLVRQWLRLVRAALGVRRAALPCAVRLVTAPRPPPRRPASLVPLRAVTRRGPPVLPFLTSPGKSSDVKGDLSCLIRFTRMPCGGAGTRRDAAGTTRRSPAGPWPRAAATVGPRSCSWRPRTRTYAASSST